jgi:hypothetical protein
MAQRLYDQDFSTVMAASQTIGLLVYDIWMYGDFGATMFRAVYGLWRFWGVVCNPCTHQIQL